MCVCVHGVSAEEAGGAQEARPGADLRELGHAPSQVHGRCPRERLQIQKRGRPPAGPQAAWGVPGGPAGAEHGEEGDRSQTDVSLGA